MTTPAESGGSPGADNRDFRRALGPWSAGSLVVGTIIGTGIFLYVADVASLLQKPWLILSAWVIGGMIAICGALCLAELAAAYPKTGGLYVYLRRAFGPLVAFEFAWTQFLIIRVASYCIQVLAFARFTQAFLGVSDPGAIRPIALTALTALCLINVVGVRWGSGVQNVLTLIKLASLALIIACGAWFMISGGEHGAMPLKVGPGPAQAAGLLVSFGLALVAVMYSFGGWDQSPFIAEEVIYPERNLPLSIIGGLGACAILYILVNWAYLTILPVDVFADSMGTTAQTALERVMGSTAGRVMSVVLMISTLGAANGLLLTGARIAYASGRDNAVFNWFAQTHPKTKTPVQGLIAQAVLGAIVIWIWDNPFFLLLYTGLAYWIFGGLIPLSLIILRRKDPHVARPFRVPLYPVVPILFLVAAAGMIVAVLQDGWKNAAITGGILSVGAMVYLVQRSLHKVPAPQ